MSYEIVAGLKLKKDVKEVWIKAASNNVSPKSYHWEEMPGLSKTYKEKGEDAVIGTIVKIYWGGTFQPGTYNTFHKAAVLFGRKNPNIHYNNIGEVLDEDLWFGPLEDIPKYLNSDDHRVKKYAKRRLEGETFDRDKDIPVVIMTTEDAKTQMCDLYKGYRSRRKGTFLIEQGCNYFAKVLSKHRWYNGARHIAKEFDSWEEAAIMCHRYSLGYENISEEK